MEKKIPDEPKWFIHYVFDNNDPRKRINAHSHGMSNIGHKDFQIVVGYPGDEVKRIINTLGVRIMNGETFSEGDMIKGIYEDCEIRVDKALEGDEEIGFREVLRLIIPDKNNRFPEDPECMDTYKHQILPK